MKKADGVGRRLAYAALLASSAVLLLLMVVGSFNSVQRTSWNASALRVEVTQLPSMGDGWLLNSGSAKELEQLPGIGPVLAGRIIENREADGPFVFPEDVMEVKGIGEKTFAGIMRWLEENPDLAYPE